MNHRYNILFAFLCCAALMGCESGSVKRTLGLKKHTPDEFMVLSRPPLAVPPDFALPPPSDSDIRPSSQVRDDAEKVLFKSGTNARDSGLSQGERSLLEQAGAEENKPGIRALIDSEYSEAYDDGAPEEKGLLDKLVDPLKPAKKDPMVDIDREEERIAKNKEEGKPVTEGEVPVKDTKNKGLINELFGL